MRIEDQRRLLVEYFKKNLIKGYTSEALKFALVKQGYSRSAIEQSFDQANKELAETAPPVREKPVIKYELYDEHNQKVSVEPLSFWEKVKYFFNGEKV